MPGALHVLVAALWVARAAVSEPHIVGHISVNVHGSGDDHQRQVPAFSHDDGAQAAFRFCAESGISDLGSLRHVAQDLQRMIDQKDHDKVDYKLRTAGAYSRRAEEHAKNGRYIEAGADLTRALLRPGLDEDQSQKIHQRLQGTMGGSKRQLEREEKGRAEEREEKQRIAAEEEQVKASQARAAELQQHWGKWLAGVSDALEPGRDPEIEDPVVGLQLTLTKGNGEQSNVHLKCCDQREKHVRLAVARFCMRHALYSAGELTKLSSMARAEAKKADAEYDMIEGPDRLGALALRPGSCRPEHLRRRVRLCVR